MVINMSNEPETSSAPIEEQCLNALKHYEEISTEAMYWSSIVPKAIRFYGRIATEIERRIAEVEADLREPKTSDSVRGELVGKLAILRTIKALMEEQ